MVLEKKKRIKKTKKTKKQKGGLNYLSPLDTIFKIGNPKLNTIRNLSNNILWKPERIDFIKEIKNLLLSNEYQENVPVFYGNQLTKNEKDNSYNEYICRKILGRLGVISSKRRIFIINPFAEFVYRIYLFCIANNYKNKINKLKNLLGKLLKTDTFIGFPKIEYLSYRTRFCIVKNNDGIERVITSQEQNISSCRRVSGCSLIMSAEIRKENLPLDEDIIELYDILDVDYKLWDFYELSKNKTEYNKINKERKLLQNKYFEGIIILLLKLNNLKTKINELKPYNSNTNNASKNSILNHPKEVRQSIILPYLEEISILNSDIPELQELYQYVKLELQQSNVNLLELTTSQLIQVIKNLIKSDPKQLKLFLSFLETKSIEESTILQILKLN